jgi:hypothetical protein
MIGNNRRGSNGYIIQMVKQVASEMGFDEKKYLTHSTRIGVSTTLLNAGQTPVIKLLDHWSLSDWYQEYPV